MGKIAADALVWWYLKASHQYGRLIKMKMPVENACDKCQEFLKKVEIWRI